MSRSRNNSAGAFAVLVLAGLLSACGGDPQPEPERPAPETKPDAKPAGGGAKAAPRAPRAPRLTAEERVFWFAERGAPASLGGPATPPAPAIAGGDTDGAPYVLGAGDVLDVRIPEDASHDAEVTVSPDGTISLDLVGGVRASGKTVAELGEALTVEFRKFLRRATPTVALKAARPAGADTVVVIGDVAKAGRLPLTGQRSLLDVLGGAGYGGKSVHLRDRITILRSGRSLWFWARHVLSLRDPRWNVALKKNDVVIIHLPEQVTVAGEVSRPGNVTLPPSGTVEVIDALASAGGVTEKADLASARIVRAWGARTESVNLNDLLAGVAGSKAPAPLGPGDTLTVPAGRPTRVFVFGMVEKPGIHRFSGRVSLAAAVSVASPKQFGALLDEARLVRGWPKTPEVIEIDLDELLLAHNASLDRELFDGDVVYIPESIVSDVLNLLEQTLQPFANIGNIANPFIQ